MSEPLAYLITWTSYGTWLPGDSRGWVDRRRKNKSTRLGSADTERLADAKRRLKRDVVVLDDEQRQLVETTIHRACQHYDWKLHDVNCRSNHIHVVLSAPNASPEYVMTRLKIWCSRKLNESKNQAKPHRWWTRHGSTRYLNDQSSFEAAINYVVNGQ